MRVIKHKPKTPSAETGFFGAFSNLLRVQGSCAPRVRRFAVVTLVSLCALAGLALPCVPAQAAISHQYLSQLTGFGDPTGVAFDAAGDVYVVDSKDRTLDRFSSAGVPLAFSAVEPYVEGSKLTGTPTGPGGSPVPFEQPEGVAVNDENGDVYVSDTAAGVVDVFSSTGEYLSQLTGPPPSAPVPGFVDPRGLTFDRSNHRLYVTNSDGGVVDVFSSTGTYLSQFGEGLFLDGLPYNYPLTESVAVNDLTEDIYVSDSLDPDSVYVFNSAESFVPPRWEGAGTPNGTFGPAARLYVGLDQSNGHVYVAATLPDVVDEFGSSTSEEYIGQLTGTPSGPFDTPQAVAVDPVDDDLYIANESGVVDIFAGRDIVVPDVTTEPPTKVTKETALLHGVVNPVGLEVTSCELEWGTEPGVYPHSAACSPAPGSGSAPVAVSAEAGALLAGTTYHYRLTATNTEGTSYAQERSFTTPVAASTLPAIESSSAEVEPAEKAGQTNATLKARIATDNSETTYHFEYGETTSYGTSVPIPGAVVFGEEPVSVMAEVHGLKLDTTYHYRVVASNEIGTVDGPDQTFTTLPAALIEDEAVSAVAATSATLEAQINPLGTATTCQVQYVASASFDATGYGSAVTVPCPNTLGEGEARVPVSIRLLQGLAPATIYHYRMVATNMLGTVDGPDQTFTTQPTAATAILPDDRGWELVSPPNKQGALIYAVDEEIADGGAYVTQAAASGDAITYLANAPTEAVAAGNANVAQVLSVRGPSGWVSRDLSPAHAIATRLSVGRGGEYRAFSSDLSQALLQPQGPFTPSLSPAASEQGPFLRTDFPAGEPSSFCTESCYRPLVTGCPKAGEPCPAAVEALADVPRGTEFGDESPCISTFICGPLVEGTTPDLRHVLLNRMPLIEPGAVGGEIYEWSVAAPPGEALQPISLLPNGKASSGETVDISAGGSRVLWHEENQLLYLRDTTAGETLPLGEGATTFQGASADGSRILFSEAGDLSLYECEVQTGASGKLECPPVKIAGGMTSGGGGTTHQAVLGASEDLSYVYFSSTEALPGSGRNQSGEVPQPGRPNLYLDRAGAISYIATVEVAGARASTEGGFLAFQSEDSLTGYENVGSHCVPMRAGYGPGDCQEVFLYDAGSDRLVCASCNPTNGRPLGPSTLPPVGNYISDSGRLFFDSLDALVPYDSDGTQDVYEYEPPGVGSCTSESVTFSERSGGCVGLISSGRSPEDSEFLGASESGDDVFFRTSARLTPRDVDSSPDVYDARVGGGEPEAAKPVECQGDACQAFVQAPNDPTPGSFTFHGPANLVPALAPPTTKKVAKKAVKCRKDKRLSHGKCMKVKKKKAKGSTNGKGSR